MFITKHDSSLLQDGDLRNGLAGQLLIATPKLTDSFFTKSVIFICAHSPEDGAMGLIVNHRSLQNELEKLFETLNIKPEQLPDNKSIILCQGGPVDVSRGIVLHTPDWQAQDSIQITNDITLTTSIEIIRAIAKGEGPDKALLALGHANWVAGQLEAEILGNAWLTASASTNLIFDTNFNSKWHRTLAELQIDTTRLSPIVGHG